MGTSENIRGVVMLLLASVILSLAVSFRQTDLILYSSVSFFIIILANVLVKKIIGYNLETVVKTKFWSWYQFGLRRDSHFKKPVPMAWLPLILSLFTQGFFWWLAILEFDVEAKAERASKRHGLYRFTEVTEWHMAIIAMWGIIANFVLAIVGYLIGFEFFAKLSIYYAFWSIIPFSSLDGSKIFFGSRIIWIVLLIVSSIFLGWGLVI